MRARLARPRPCPPKPCTQQDIRWLSQEAWDACNLGEIDESLFEKRVCFAGLDLSTTTDLSALVLVFLDDDGTVTLKRSPSEAE